MASRTTNHGAAQANQLLRSSNTIAVLTRNIDKVLFGELLFETWYFSPYPDAVLFGADYLAPKPTITSTMTIINNNGSHSQSTIAETKVASLTDELCVCPYCFKYCTSRSDHGLHLQSCTRSDRGGEWTPVPASAERVYDWNGYTVWDVDGEQEKLYCQNLSLFAKLFLEQKSVFFDTSGFHYFVLTHRSDGSAQSDSRTTRKIGHAHSRSGSKDSVLGFFSKETLSWDSNNLACILVFPPFQHRNLGQLLMGVSYKLSGWEWEDGVIGGPEKPLSVMGLRSYLRFWSERIARFFMSQTNDAEGGKLFDGLNNGSGKTKHSREEISVAEIGRRTGMLSEDVVAALVHMGICEVTSSKRKQKVDNDSNLDDAVVELKAVTVKRTAVLAWIRQHRVLMDGPVQEEGFLGEWALSSPGSERSQQRSESAES